MHFEKGFLAPLSELNLNLNEKIGILIENTPSMSVWMRDLIIEIKNLEESKENQVLVWSWSPDISTPAVNLNFENFERLEQIPKEVKIVFIFSDCVSTAWQNNSVLSQIKELTVQTQIVLVPVLPPDLWSHTNLQKGKEVLLTWENNLDAPWRRWGKNSQMESSDTVPLYSPNYLKEAFKSGFPFQAEGGKYFSRLKLPLCVCDFESFTNWVNYSNTPASKRTEFDGFDGIIFSAKLFKPENDKNIKDIVVKSLPTDPDKLVDRFWEIADPKSQRLALCLAMFPVLNLETIMKVREWLKGREESDEVWSIKEDAQIILGGLVTLVLPEADQKEQIKLDLDQVQFEFKPGVRENLLYSLPLDWTQQLLFCMEELLITQLDLTKPEYRELLSLSRSQALPLELKNKRINFFMETLRKTGILDK